MIQQTMPAVAGAILMHSEATILDALTAFGRNSDKQTIFVLNNTMQYTGSITRNTLLEFLTPYLDFLNQGEPQTLSLRLRKTQLQDLLHTNPDHHGSDSSLKEKIITLLSKDTDTFPTLDSTGHITGEVSSQDLTEELLSALRGR